MATSKLLEGARNLIRYADIGAGHEVLIHSEFNPEDADDAQVLEALHAAASEVGARASILRTPMWNKMTEGPPRVLEAAIDLLRAAYDAARERRFETGSPLPAGVAGRPG